MRVRLPPLVLSGRTVRTLLYLVRKGGVSELSQIYSLKPLSGNFEPCVSAKGQKFRVRNAGTGSGGLTPHQNKPRRVNKSYGPYVCPVVFICSVRFLHSPLRIVKSTNVKGWCTL